MRPYRGYNPALLITVFWADLVVSSQGHFIISVNGSEDIEALGNSGDDGEVVFVLKCIPMPRSPSTPEL